MDIVGISEKEQVHPFQRNDLTALLHRDKKDYLLTSLSLSLSLSQEAIFRVVAAILHLGNIVFTKGKEIDSSVPKDDQSKFHLKMTSELLMYEFCCNNTYIF